MEETILKSILNFGIFPTVTIYLILIIIKDFKAELKVLRSLEQENLDISVNQYAQINNSLKRLIDINIQMQNYLNNYLNSLMIKLLDVLDDYNRK